ncbi:hypothetical protein BKA64DRAFT_684551 [Cadophora sp. MPI-SDFR-AT-0126]|nr:hypothetical protein BKA64DRAFT_684551 [Leotiomycetes sp. MPI-SDFR-AT-0126]
MEASIPPFEKEICYILSTTSVFNQPNLAVAMRLRNISLLFIVNSCNAANWCLDSSCSSKPGLAEGIKGGIGEATDLANNAIAVMTAHADDQWVRKMAKYILGTDDFDGKFSRARGTFAAVMGYQKVPLPFQPQDPAWTSSERNVDLEVYCDDARIFKRTPDSVLSMDAALPNKVMGPSGRDLLTRCYEPNFIPGSGVEASKAITRTSNTFDLGGYRAEKKINPNVQRQNYEAPQPNVACVMDICTWFSAAAAVSGWPIVNAERVEACKTDEFKAKLSNGLTPVDGLKTFGTTMLHELTHTIQGGTLVDIDVLPPGIDSCYNWICIGGLKNERNADSIAMLGLAMKLWSLKHYADDDGSIYPIP